jgi:hypothetical protein
MLVGCPQLLSDRDISLLAIADRMVTPLNSVTFVSVNTFVYENTLVDDALLL